MLKVNITFDEAIQRYKSGLVSLKEMQGHGPTVLIKMTGDYKNFNKIMEIIGDDARNLNRNI
jgi:hypothetical protein